MPLISTFWNSNARLQSAAGNHPGMRAPERDHDAVRLLQQALVNTRVAASTTVNGNYDAQTGNGVRAVETRFNMDRDGGAAGREVLGILDILLQNGNLGADLARTDVPLATRKVQAAIQALTNLEASLTAHTAPSPITADALRIHFRLTVVRATVGVARLVTVADIHTILGTYRQLLGLYGAAATRFRTGVPVNGIFIPAEAPVGGPVRFGPAYTNVDSNFGRRIGPNSRAAILIHEGTHVFDSLSGRANIHISEFQREYDSQDPDLSLHNPSSYAGFAANIDNGGEPPQRFGLGPGQRL